MRRTCDREHHLPSPESRHIIPIHCVATLPRARSPGRAAAPRLARPDSSMTDALIDSVALWNATRGLSWAMYTTPLNNKMALFSTSSPVQTFWDSLKSISWPNSDSCSQCGRSHAFRGLTGNVVLVGGFYGSHLKHIETNTIMLESFKDLFKREEGILSWQETEETNHIPHQCVLCFILFLGTCAVTLIQPNTISIRIIEKFGLFDLCSRLVHEMKSWQDCSQGTFRFHPFP